MQVSAFFVLVIICHAELVLASLDPEINSG